MRSLRKKLPIGSQHGKLLSRQDTKRNRFSACLPTEFSHHPVFSMANHFLWLLFFFLSFCRETMHASHVLQFFFFFFGCRMLFVNKFCKRHSSMPYLNHIAYDDWHCTTSNTNRPTDMPSVFVLNMAECKQRSYVLWSIKSTVNKRDKNNLNVFVFSFSQVGSFRDGRRPL